MFLNQPWKLENAYLEYLLNGYPVFKVLFHLDSALKTLGRDWVFGLALPANIFEMNLNSVVFLYKRILPD